ncbi:MAG: hypothetical protein ABJB11_21670 [Ferruginibacter sp.]
MKKNIQTYVYLVIACTLLSVKSLGQLKARLNTVESTPLFADNTFFDSDAVLDITLSGNLHVLLNDRSVDSKYHPITVSYKNKDGSNFNITAKAKTRGHFRKLRSNCDYPPLLLNFSTSDSLELSVFKGQNKLKLVMPCAEDNFVIREWLVYKMYNLITPKSFRTKLVRIKLADSKKNKNIASFYGLLLEDESAMARRNGLISVNKKTRPEYTNRINFLTMSVFQYLIANTDWSVQYNQNVKLIAPDTLALPTVVPYDFDHAGIVETPYAKPPEELDMNSIRERRYRGYCIADMKQFEPIVEFYISIKKDIYNLYTDCSLLDTRYRDRTIAYLDEFYLTITTPELLQKAFGYPCDKNGTGHIIIRGLKEDK